MDKLLSDIERARAAARKRGLSSQQIEEAFMGDYRIKKQIDATVHGQKLATTAAVVGPALLWSMQIFIAERHLDVDLPVSVIMSIWALSVASIIHNGYGLVKLQKYLSMPGLPKVEEYDEDEDLAEEGD